MHEHFESSNDARACATTATSLTRRWTKWTAASIATLGVAAALGCGGKVETPPGPGPTTTDASTRRLTILSTQGGSGTWVGPSPLHYSLSFDAPSSMVSVLEGRPFTATAPQPLADWVDDWQTLGETDGAPHAYVKIERADGTAQSFAIEVLDLELAADGALEANVNLTANESGGGDLYPTFDFTHAFFINDNQHGLIEGDSSTGLFTLSGSTATLVPSADPVYPLSLTLTGANHASSVAQGDAPSVSRHTLGELALNWSRRFEEVPHASVTISTEGQISGGTSTVLQLGEPTVSDGVITFPASPVSGAAGSASFFNAQIVGDSTSVSMVTVDDAPQQVSTACITNGHCEGTSVCEPDTGACVYLTCDIAAKPSDCAATEKCLSVDGATGPITACFPNFAGACTLDEDCRELIKAPVVCLDKICQPRTCPTSETECFDGQQCVSGICYSTQEPGTNFPNQEGILWGSTWSTPARQTVCTMLDPKMRAFCGHFEQALEDRVVNILEALVMSGDDFTYFGRNFFATNTQFGIVAAGTAASFSSPPDAIKDALNAPFGIVDSAYMNYSSRLAGQLTGTPNYDPFPDGAPAALATDFLDPFYTSLKTSVLAHDPVVTTCGSPDGLVGGSWQGRVKLYSTAI